MNNSPNLISFLDLLWSVEIQRNREFYKSADVRPPFTYASLIRQVSRPKFNCFCFHVFSFCLIDNPPPPTSVHHRVSRQAVDPQRNLQLVPEHILLLPTERRNMEGKNSKCIERKRPQRVCWCDHIILFNSTLRAKLFSRKRS